MIIKTGTIFSMSLAAQKADQPAGSPSSKRVQHFQQTLWTQGRSSSRRSREGGREKEGEGEGERVRERERESRVRRVGGKVSREEGGKWWKRIRELTYWLQWCSHQMHDFRVRRLARESWKFAVIHWPWHASLRYLAELNSPPPWDIRPDASRLRMVFVASAPAATVLKQVHHRPCNNATTMSYTRCLTFHCFSKSTVLLGSSSWKKSSWDWRVTQTAVLVARSLARHFFTWKPWRNDRLKYLH